MRLRFVFAFLAFLAFPFALIAQGGTISPGMNRAQVVAALGEPATSRVASEYTYLFYRNDCGRSCGMNDLVVLRRDSVVDAIFRSSSRKYTGESSSPAPLTRGEARTGTVAAKPAAAPKPRAATAATAATTAATAKALPMTKDVPAPAAAAAVPTRTPTAEQLAVLRRELLGTGLTTSQIRARLRAQGYPENTLDADIRAATAQPAPVQKKPSAPNDTHPSVPAGEPPVRKAPASATPPASTRPPAP